jgi:periplasmic protein TonB
MFDKLVESARQKQRGRARGLLLATGAFYAVALTALSIVAIVGIRPALAEEYYMLSDLIPPPPPPVYTQSSPAHPKFNSAPRPSFAQPRPIVDIPPPNPLINIDFEPRVPVPVAPSWAGIGRQGAPGGTDTREAPPPPPPPTPTPVVKPAATPTPDTVVRLTSKLTQGRVLRKVQPPYPEIARKARIQGSVQVQIDISETGAVTNVILLSGNPLLRDAALQAAKQWLFIPTELNGRPVRAIGVLTFNFVLN